MKKRQRYTSPRTNPIITAWRHLGCNLSYDMFDSIFRSIWLNWQLNRAMKKLHKTMTPEQIKYLDSLS